MTSFNHIPEPSTAYRPIDDEPSPKHAPLPLGPGMESIRDDSSKHAEENSVASWLFVMIGSALMLRVGMLYFGAFKGIDPATSEQWVSIGKRLLDQAGASSSSWPAFPMLAALSEQIGMPAWFVVLVGTLITLAAIPASYALAQRMTGSATAGLILAAIVGFHPAALTAAAAFGPLALSLGFITVGLALISLSSKHGHGAAVPGSLMLGLAALTAPIAWAAIPLGVILAAQTKTIRTNITRGLAVLCLASAPAVGWYMATGAQPVTHPYPGTTWPTQHDTSHLEAMTGASTRDKIIFGLTSNSLEQLGQTLHAPIHGKGPLTSALIPTSTHPPTQDPVANVLVDLWTGLNLALCLAAGAGFVMLCIRRRYALAVALALPLLLLIFGNPLLGEAGRVGLLALQGGLAAGLFAVPAAPRLTEQERAERDAKRLAKAEQKELAKLAKAEKAAKVDIHGFDQPTTRNAERRDRRDRRDRRGRLNRSAEDRTPESNHLKAEATLEPPPPMGRPI